MLFHISGDTAIYQWVAMLGVLASLILLNEFSRRTKFGGILMFFCFTINFNSVFYRNLCIS